MWFTHCRRNLHRNHSCLKYSVPFTGLWLWNFFTKQSPAQSVLERLCYSDICEDNAAPFLNPWVISKNKNKQKSTCTPSTSKRRNEHATKGYFTSCSATEKLQEEKQYMILTGARFKPMPILVIAFWAHEKTKFKPS